MDKRGQSVYIALAFIVIVGLIAGVILNSFQSGLGNPLILVAIIILAALIFLAFIVYRG